MVFFFYCLRKHKTHALITNYPAATLSYMAKSHSPAVMSPEPKKIKRQTTFFVKIKQYAKVSIQCDAFI